MGWFSTFSTPLALQKTKFNQSNPNPLLPLTHLFPLVLFWCPVLWVVVVVINVVVVVVVIIRGGGGHQPPQLLEGLAETRLLPPQFQLLIHCRAGVEGSPLAAVPGSGTRGRVPSPLAPSPRPAASLGLPKRGHVLLEIC